MTETNGFTPDFERLRKILLLQGEPDRVPHHEVGVDRPLKERYLGRAIRTFEDEAEFWVRSGYSTISVSHGLTEVLTPATRTHVMVAQYGTTGDLTQRRWLHEGKGLITNDREFDSFPWPDPDALDYSQFEQAEKHLVPNMEVVGSLGKVYNGVWWLMGIEAFSYALVENPDLVARMFDKVGAFQYRVLENLLKFRHVRLIWHADDMAYTEGLMVKPEVIRKYVFPWYVEMNRLCRDRGVLAVLHSDGKLTEVLEDIVAAGFNGLNPIEPKAMDIVEVKKKVGDRLALIGNIDLGYTLTRGTPQEVEEEVRLRIRQCAPGGGYCVASSNSVTEYVPYENYLAMREATWKYGVYPITV